LAVILKQLSEIFAYVFKSRRAEVAAAVVSVVAGVVLNHIATAPMNRNALCLLFHKYHDTSDGAEGTALKPLFSHETVSNVIDHLLKNHRMHTIADLMALNQNDIYRIDIRDILSHRTLLIGLTLDRNGQEIVNQGDRNWFIWDNILRNSDPATRDDFCGYLVQSLRGVVEFAQRHTIGSTTKTLFTETISAYHRLGKYIKESSHATQLQALVTEARKTLKTKKAVVEILMNLDASRLGSI
jgi:hypothetical protein